MSVRMNPPRLKVVVEFEIIAPEPAEITKDMVDRSHEALRLFIKEGINKNNISLTGDTVGRYVTTTRMVK